MEVVDPYRGWEGEYPKDLLNFLNGAPPISFSDLTTSDRQAEAIGMMNRLLIITPRIRASAENEFLSTLRDLVDQWLASGKSENGDCPWERKIPLHTLREFIRRNPPYLGLKTPSGPLLLDLEPLPVQKADPLVVARDAATYLFLKLLDSPARARLSRCDACKMYFVRTRTPKKDTPIYHGIFCEKHKGKGGAKRTVESRERRKQQIVGLAAEWWPKWKQTRHGQRSKWIAKEVNKKLPHWAAPIGGKWITQHQQEIEAEAERRK